MIPVIGSDGWFLVPLPPTKFAAAKLAKVNVRDGLIVAAFARERPDVRPRILHWAAGVGSWTEVA